MYEKNIKKKKHKLNQLYFSSGQILKINHRFDLRCKFKLQQTKRFCLHSEKIFAVIIKNKKKWQKCRKNKKIFIFELLMIKKKKYV